MYIKSKRIYFNNFLLLRLCTVSTWLPFATATTSRADSTCVTSNLNHGVQEQGVFMSQISDITVK